MNLGVGDRRALANLIAQALVGKVYTNEHELTGVIVELLNEFLGPAESVSLGGIGGAFKNI